MRYRRGRGRRRFGSRRHRIKRALRRRGRRLLRIGYRM